MTNSEIIRLRMRELEEATNYYNINIKELTYYDTLELNEDIIHQIIDNNIPIYHVQLFAKGYDLYIAGYLDEAVSMGGDIIDIYNYAYYDYLNDMFHDNIVEYLEYLLMYRLLDYDVEAVEDINGFIDDIVEDFKVDRYIYYPNIDELIKERL